MSRQKVAEIMHKRAKWILRHLQKFTERPPQSPLSSKPNAGAYTFLGRQLTLKLSPVEKSTPAKERVAIEKDTLRVWLKDINNKVEVNTLLDKWSREQADVIFLTRMLLLHTKFKERSSDLPGLKIRLMKARWGSCSANGVITLNIKLIHLDLSLIDYVIMHELCHLIEHNHSKNYYALLERMMPDWRLHRQRLNELGMPE